MNIYTSLDLYAKNIGDKSQMEGQGDIHSMDKRKDKTMKKTVSAK